MIFRLNRRAQEEAPFEVLIAVVLMGFVLSIGIYATNELAKKKCEGEVSEILNNFKTVLEKSSKGYAVENFYYKIPNCYSQDKSELKIIQYSQKQICYQFCGGVSSVCHLAYFLGKNDKNANLYSKAVCLDIPTNFRFSDSSICGNPTAYGANSSFNLGISTSSYSGDSLLPGRYVIVNTSHNAADYNVCLYRR